MTNSILKQLKHPISRARHFTTFISSTPSKCIPQINPNPYCNGDRPGCPCRFHRSTQEAVQPRHASAQCQRFMHRLRSGIPPYIQQIDQSTISHPPQPAAARLLNTTVLPGISPPIIRPHISSRLRSVTTEKRVVHCIVLHRRRVPAHPATSPHYSATRALDLCATKARRCDRSTEPVTTPPTTTSGTSGNGNYQDRALEWTNAIEWHRRYFNSSGVDRP